MRSLGKLCTLVAGLSLVFTGTAVADDTVPYSVDIAVTAAFDKTAYNSDDTVGVDVTVTNAGTDPVSVYTYDGWDTGELMLDDASRELLNQRVDMASGESRALHLTGTVRETNAEHQVIFSVTAEPWGAEENPDDNTATVTAPVTQVYGDVTGRVHTADGASLAGVEVTLADYWTLDGQTMTTGADGSYRFTHLPSGKYYLTFKSDDGWIFRNGSNLIDVTHLGVNTDVLAVRPLSDTLHASVTFDKHHYQVGATAKVTFTLHNSAATPVENLTALTNGGGTDADLWLTDCGVLATGVDVPAGQTVTVTCSGTVSDKADALGLLSLSADFGYDYGGPVVGTTARVGDHLGYADARLVHDANGNDIADDDEGVAGARLSVINTYTDEVATRTTTAANGDYSVKDLPTGVYWVHVDGPWQPANGKFLLWVTTKGACAAYCGRWDQFVTPR